MAEDFLKLGIQAAQAGDRKRAQSFLVMAVQQTPQSAQAWYWLGHVLDDPEKKKYCLERAAKLDATLVDEPAAVSPTPETPAAKTTASPALVSAPKPDPQLEEATRPAPVEKKPPARRKPSAAVLLGISALVILFLCAAGLLVYTFLQARQASTPAQKQANILQPGSTARVLPTLIPSATPRPRTIVTRTPTPSPSATAALNPTQLYDRLGLQITAARSVLDNHAYPECINSYDRLLEALPDWSIGYYNRGLCKRGAANDLHYLGDYEDYLRGAIADQDRAIILNPQYSNAYVERAFDYINLMEVLDNTAEEKVSLDIALENIEKSLALNTTHPSAQLNRAIIPIHLGRCQEGLEYAYRLIETTEPGEPKAVLDSVLAGGHLCLGEYADALRYMEESQALKPDNGKVPHHAAILIGLGRLDDAFEVTARSIQAHPGYGGMRYYLRAYLYLERGEYELARQDLFMGAGNTWYHGGMYAYVMGMLALHDGDTEGAAEYLTFAADSVHPDDGLWLKQRIQSELSKLGVQYVPPTPAVEWNVTPIPK